MYKFRNKFTTKLYHAHRTEFLHDLVVKMRRPAPSFKQYHTTTTTFTCIIINLPAIQISTGRFIQGTSSLSSWHKNSENNMHHQRHKCFHEFFWKQMLHTSSLCGVKLNTEQFTMPIKVQSNFEKKNLILFRRNIFLRKLSRNKQIRKTAEIFKISDLSQTKQDFFFFT